MSFATMKSADTSTDVNIRELIATALKRASKNKWPKHKLKEEIELALGDWINWLECAGEGEDKGWGKS